MNCLFWNVNKGKLNSYIVDIVTENEIDILALAEYEDDIEDLKKRFISKKYDLYELQNLGSRVTILTTFQPG